MFNSFKQYAARGARENCLTDEKTSRFFVVDLIEPFRQFSTVDSRTLKTVFELAFLLSAQDALFNRAGDCRESPVILEDSINPVQHR